MTCNRNNPKLWWMLVAFLVMALVDFACAAA